jgi:hypothetical protein
VLGLTSWTPPGPVPGPTPVPPPPAIPPPPWYPPPPPGYPPLPHVTPPDPTSAEPSKVVGDLAISASIVFAWFAVAAVLGALIWDKVTTLPAFTRVATTGSMDEEQLSHQFSISGWFLVIAVVGGLVSGIVLVLLRRKNPIAVVLVVAVGSALATWVMLQVGLALGPDNPNAALATATFGQKVPVQLKPDVNAVYYAWTIAALFGSIFSLWILETTVNSRQRKAPTSSPYYG